RRAYNTKARLELSSRAVSLTRCRLERLPDVGTLIQFVTQLSQLGGIFLAGRFSLHVESTRCTWKRRMLSVPSSRNPMYRPACATFHPEPLGLISCQPDFGP